MVHVYQWHYLRDFSREEKKNNQSVSMADSILNFKFKFKALNFKFNAESFMQQLCSKMCSSMALDWCAFFFLFSIFFKYQYTYFLITKSNEVMYHIVLFFVDSLIFEWVC